MSAQPMKDPPPGGTGVRACPDSDTGGLAGGGSETREVPGRHPATYEEGAGPGASGSTVRPAPPSSDFPFTPEQIEASEREHRLREFDAATGWNAGARIADDCCCQSCGARGHVGNCMSCDNALYSGGQR